LALALPFHWHRAQRTGTTTAHAGTIDPTQASIGFSALLLDTKLLVGWTMQCPIWLDGESAA
jgi:hypothetical protein